MNRKNEDNPVRLEKIEEKTVLDILNKDFMFKVKFYFLLIIAMIIFLAICFLIQKQTYGFINW